MNTLLLTEIALRGNFSVLLSVYGFDEPTKFGELRLPLEVHNNLDVLVCIFALIVESELDVDCYMTRVNGRFCPTLVFTAVDAPKANSALFMHPTRRNYQ